MDKAKDIGGHILLEQVSNQRWGGLEKLRPAFGSGFLL